MWSVYFKCLHIKSEGVWYLSFPEEHLSMGWSRNLDSSTASVLEISGSNPGAGSNFSLENLILTMY
jgi:hypothetical protein